VRSLTWFKQNRDSRPARLLRWRGGTLVETAICGAVLMVFTFGVVEASWFFYCKNIMNGAAREACRNGILQSVGTTSGNATSCNTTIINYLGNAGLTPHGTTATGGTGTYTIGNYHVYYYDYNYNTATLPGTTVDPNNVAVGDGLYVKITASWATIGSFARSSAAGGQYISPTEDPGNIDAWCIMRKEAQ
jgi:Flp pilus assembly protein TadG